MNCESCVSKINLQQRLKGTYSKVFAKLFDMDPVSIQPNLSMEPENHHAVGKGTNIFQIPFWGSMLVFGGISTTVLAFPSFLGSQWYNIFTSWYERSDEQSYPQVLRSTSCRSVIRSWHGCFHAPLA